MYHRRAVLAALLLVGIVPAMGLAQEYRSSPLTRRLERLVGRHQGKISVVVHHLESGERYAHAADEPMPTASLIKLPLMIEAYRQAEAGTLDLDAMKTLREEDKVPGSGILTGHFSAGASFPLRDAIRMMIRWSDNTATNLVIDRVGLAATRDTMATLGCPNTQLHSKVFRRDTSIDLERSKRFGLGSTTAAEMEKLLIALHEDELVSADASAAMRAHLRTCLDREMLARFLPPGVKLAHKSGQVSDARCDAGLMTTSQGTVVCCVLTAENGDKRWSSDNAAMRVIAEIGREVANHYHRPQPVDDGFLPLTQGAGGARIERIQRALNAVLEPSPELAVDGDFGPITAAAVTRFQENRKLKATGIIDAATWDALQGPLAAHGDATEQAVEPPPPRQPADAAEGAPFVTADAWAVADATTGAVLFSENAEDRRAMASTTKVMTALLVVEHAEEHADVLNELVTFSERADETPGSTSGVRVGESVPVGELLYGLLLPSGNDASVALAEHFGHRLMLDGAGSPEATLDPHDRFVACMNLRAEQLGMKGTHFMNPHGLSHREHHSSAADLVKLAVHALSLPEFAKVVHTRQYVCKLRAPDGGTRQAVWRNTNRLLAIEGYDGVKTGTTSDAGACLISRGTQGGRTLITVVLGAAASEARYTDSRNLYRWAFGQLAAE